MWETSQVCAPVYKRASVRLHVTDRFILEMFYILLLKVKKKQKQYTKQLQFDSCK